MNTRDLNQLKDGIRAVFSRWRAKAEEREQGGEPLTASAIALIQEEVNMVIMSIEDRF